MTNAEKIAAWKKYGYEQQKGEMDRPAFLRRPEPPTSMPRSFSLGDLKPGAIRLADGPGYDGFSVSLACLISFGAGIVTCRILQGFF